MVQWYFVELLRTILVSSCGLKSHYNSRVSLHEAPTKNANQKRRYDGHQTNFNVSTLFRLPTSNLFKRFCSSVEFSPIRDKDRCHKIWSCSLLNLKLFLNKFSNKFWNEETVFKFMIVSEYISWTVFLIPPSGPKGEVRHKAQIQLWRHRLRWNFGPIK